jgi:hypothetical protein
MWTAVRNWWERWRVARAGPLDGRRGIPAPSDPHLPFALREDLARAQDALWRLAREWRRGTWSLGARAGGSRGPGGLGPRASSGGTGASGPRASSGGTGSRGRWPDPVPDLRPHPAAAQRPLAGARAPEPPPTAPEAASGGFGIRPEVYWSVILLVVAAELPLNAFVFRLFGEPDLLSMVMTLGLAVALVLTAHGVGILARRAHRGVGRYLLVGLVAISVLTIAAVSLTRAPYLKVRREHAGRERTARWRAARALALRRRAHFEGLLHAYCAANVRAREDRRTPHALERLPEVPLPVEFVGDGPPPSRG